MVAHSVRNVAWLGKRRDRQERNANAILIKVRACRREWPGGIERELRAQIRGVFGRGVRGA